MHVPAQRRSIIHATMWAGMIVCVALMMATPSARADNPSRPAKPVINLVTLDWPPYTGANLPDGGLLAHVVTAALDQVDINHTIEVYPWKRAVLDTLRENGFEAIFPLYDNPERRRQFLLSDPIGISPLGFVHMPSTKFSWKNLTDLNRYAVGYVTGYGYEPRLRAMLENKSMNSFGMRDDETLLRQLIAGYVDVAVIDHNVARYLLHNSPGLRDAEYRVVYNPHLVIEQTIHVGFPPSSQGLRNQNAFNNGLGQLSCIPPECIPDAVANLLPSDSSAPKAEIVDSQ
ncbi:MAG: transporter substrate-binding domain-containing protein [Thalassospira sp.]|uniref:substrate-binding periplasmic protein n=1 Tax=Thalassospira sp. TaxID=1912094 RepID=UPI0032EDB7BB